MQYRVLGKTGASISAVALGGHWKGLSAVLGRAFQGTGYDEIDFENIRCPDFLANRASVVARAAEMGVNYIDACSPPEILVYARLLRDCRRRFLLGYSWHTREPRFPEYRSAGALMDGLDRSLAEAGLDYIDLWRISLPVDGVTDPAERSRIEDAVIAGLDCARRQGKARFTGVSSHDRGWLAEVSARYPEQIQVILFPFTAGSGQAPGGSLLETVAGGNTGAIAIKPFGGGALFDGSVRDARSARLAIRHILSHAPISAVIPGFASVAQLENAVSALSEGPLDVDEKSDLFAAAARLVHAAPWLHAWQLI